MISTGWNPLWENKLPLFLCCAYIFECVCTWTAALSSAEEAFVIELMLASVRQAAEGPPLSGRGAGKKVRLSFKSII